MKILHWAIILVIIVLPISMTCYFNVNAKISALKDEVRINNAIDTATQDAIDQLISLDSSIDFEGRFGDVIDVTPALAQEMIDTFFHTLATNYNIPYQSSDHSPIQSESYIKNYFSSYIPVIVVLAYDGFYVYSMEDRGAGYVYQLSTKIPYVVDYKSSSGKTYSIGYTLGNDIYFYYNNKCYSGKLNGNTRAEIEARYDEYVTMTGKTGSELADLIYNISDDISCIMYALDSDIRYLDNSIMPDNSITNFLADYTYNVDGSINEMAGPFQTKRRETIVNIITAVLSEEINEHKSYANLMGVTYDFSFPTLSRQDWMNTIEDISIFAFVQGIPIGNAKGTYYNNFALGGSKIVRANRYIISKKDGVYYYHEEDCPYINAHSDEIEVYGVKSKYSASKNYSAYPCSICN